MKDGFRKKRFEIKMAKNWLIKTRWGYTNKISFLFSPLWQHTSILIVVTFWGSEKFSAHRLSLTWHTKHHFAVLIQIRDSFLFQVRFGRIIKHRRFALFPLIQGWSRINTRLSSLFSWTLSFLISFDSFTWRWRVIWCVVAGARMQETLLAEVGCWKRIFIRTEGLLWITVLIGQIRLWQEVMSCASQISICVTKRILKTVVAWKIFGVRTRLTCATAAWILATGTTWLVLDASTFGSDLSIWRCFSHLDYSLLFQVIFE